MRRDGLSSPIVEIFFTGLLVLMGLATMWFAGYVVYRMFNDQRS